MNKGLEIIEACHLFGINSDDVEVLIHRESIVHSMIETKDGSILAQLAVSDMRIPIQLALTYPDRLPSPAKRLDLTKTPPLTFQNPDEETFSLLPLCKRAIKLGGNALALSTQPTRKR